MVGENGFVYPASPAGTRFRQDCSEAQPWVATGPVADERFFVNVRCLPGAPVEVNFPRWFAVIGTFQDVT